jgi:hypothetical protein
LYNGPNEELARRIFEDYDKTDVPKELLHKEGLYVELIRENGDDWEIIALKDLERGNSKSDELLTRVERHYQNLYGGYKYFEIDVEDNNGEYAGTISLRISDHTQNIYNIDKYGYDYSISVVIADYDPTEERFGTTNKMERRANEVEMRFTSNDEYGDILEKIDTTLGKMAKKIIDS